jgi:heme exporter protein CcmD
MQDAAALLTMGGYGRFVWAAFAVTGLVLALLLVSSLRALKSRELLLRRMEHDLKEGQRR